MTKSRKPRPRKLLPRPKRPPKRPLKRKLRPKRLPKPPPPRKLPPRNKLLPSLLPLRHPNPPLLPRRPRLPRRPLLLLRWHRLLLPVRLERLTDLRLVDVSCPRKKSRKTRWPSLKHSKSKRRGYCRLEGRVVALSSTTAAAISSTVYPSSSPPLHLDVHWSMFIQILMLTSAVIIAIVRLKIKWIQGQLFLFVRRLAMRQFRRSVYS